MGTGTQVKAAEPAMSVGEAPELRQAYAAEREAVANVVSIRDRLPIAQGGVHLRRRDRDALTSRAARDPNVTGADLRKAEEAIQEAEALVTLLTEALPKAEAAAIAAATDREGVVGGFNMAKAAPFRADLDAAEAALRAAQAARDQAHARAKDWPAEFRAELDAIHAAHGHDRVAVLATDELRRLEQVARSRKMNL